MVIGAVNFLLLVGNFFVYLAFDKNANDGLLLAVGYGLVVGQFFGQLSLIAVWAGVSSEGLLLRLPWAILLTTLMWFSFAIGGRLDGPYSVDQITVFAVGVLQGLA